MTRSSYKLLVTVALLTTASRLSAQDPEVVLTIAPVGKKTIRIGESVYFVATITNRGSKPVTLVQPGDGSNCRLRTPVVGWSVLEADANAQKHPATVPPFKGFRGCGNINSLRMNEVFTLPPGAGIRLADWIGHPIFEKPGRFRVVFYYHNIPDLELAGIPLGQHDGGVLAR